MGAADFDVATARAVRLTQAQIAATAIAANAKVMQSSPQPLSMVRHVDGVEGAPEEAVKQDGVIVYDYGRVDLVAEFALETLRQLSPVDSGDYARSHVLMLNDQVVDDLSGWKPGDIVTISNSEPYTRKIELGQKGYRANGHVYEKAERIVSRRFGNIANVWFVYRPAPPGAIRDWAAKTNLRRAGSADNRTQWLLRQPSLLIREIR